MSKPKVIIIGAGPGGLAIALTLSMYGVPFLLVEKTEERSAFTKALTLQPRTLEILEALNVLKSLIPKGNPITKTHIWKNGKQVGSFDYKNIPSRCNYLLSVTQPEVESTLESALSEQIHRGWECVDVIPSDNSCQVTLQNVHTGEQQIIDAPYVIAADGGKSRIRSILLQKGQVHLTKQGRYDTNFIMGDFTMPDYPFPRNERQTFFQSKMLCTFIPMVSPEVRLVAFGLTKETGSEPLPEEFHDIVTQITDQKIDLSQGKWLNRFYPARFILNQLRVKSLFFIGDSGHIISPIGAQGINLSIEDAFNLGWKLGMVLSQSANPSILDTYSHERKLAATTVLNETDSLHKDLSQKFRHFFFMQKLKFLKNSEVSHTVLLKQTQFFIDYDKYKTPLTQKNNAPFKKGMRMTQFSTLPKTSFSLVLNPFKNPPEIQSTSLCTVISKQSHPRFAQSDPYLLVRPDGYILETYKTVQEAKQGIDLLRN